ncbi:MAG: hypothetical protein IKL53_01330, partial [Lachnospiraceae bacterium]|nr:hypothetical protein [Lachnospiraceae bacterium]
MNRRLSFKLHARLLAIMLVFVLVLSGCNQNKKPEPTDTKSSVVFQFGDNIVTLGEVYIYAQTVGERYERQYGEDVWSLSIDGEDGEKVPMTDIVKEEVVNEIVRVKSMVTHAGEYDITLSETEKNMITEEA